MTWLLVLACAQSAYYMLLTTSLSDRKSLLAWTKYWFSYFAVELRHINVVLVKSRTDFNRMLALSSVVGVFMSVLSILLGKNNFENLIFLLFMHIFIFETLTTLLNILCKPRKGEFFGAHTHSWRFIGWNLRPRVRRTVAELSRYLMFLDMSL